MHIVFLLLLYISGFLTVFSITIYNLRNAFRNTGCHGLVLNNTALERAGIFLRTQVYPDSLISLRQHKEKDASLVKRNQEARGGETDQQWLFHLGVYGFDLQTELQINTTLRGKSKIHMTLNLYTRRWQTLNT